MALVRDWCAWRAAARTKPLSGDSEWQLLEFVAAKGGSGLGKWLERDLAAAQLRVSPNCPRAKNRWLVAHEAAVAAAVLDPVTHEAAVAVAKRPRSRSRAGRSKAIRIRSPAPVAARAANANSLPREGKFWVGWIREAIVGGLRDQRSAAVAAQGPRSFFVRTIDLEQRLGSRQVRRDSRDGVAFRI